MSATIALLDDNIKSLQDNFINSHNKLMKNIESFDLKLKLSEKDKLIRNSFQILFYLEKCLREIEYEFALSPSKIKSSYYKTVKNDRVYFEKAKNDLTKLNDLLENLKKGENKKDGNASFVQRQLPELQYSKILAVQNMANFTFKKTSEIIQNIDLELQKHPLVSSKDSQAFNHFIKYNDNKIQMKKEKRYWLRKRMILCLVIVVILFVIYIFDK